MLDQTEEARGFKRAIETARSHMFHNKLLLVAILCAAVLWPVAWLVGTGRLLGVKSVVGGDQSLWDNLRWPLTLVGVIYSLVVALGASQPVLRHRAEGFLLPFALYVALWTEIAFVGGFLGIAKAWHYLYGAVH